MSPNTGKRSQTQPAWFSFSSFLFTMKLLSSFVCMYECMYVCICVYACVLQTVGDTSHQTTTLVLGLSVADSAYSCPLHLISGLWEFHPLTQIILREKGDGEQRLGWPHLNVELPHLLMVEILLPWTTEPRWLKIAEWSCSFRTQCFTYRTV